jgi:signal transduction histidine kinase
VTLRSSKTWWLSFAVLVAAPALALAALGLRVIQLERLEREQRFREQQSQLARMADTAVTNAVVELENELRRSEASAGKPPEWPVFVLEPGGRIVFFYDKLYFPDPGSTESPSAETWPPKIDQTIEAARAAEAGQLWQEALALYTQVGLSDAGLRTWVDLEIERIRRNRGETPARTLLADPAWSRSDGLSPGGVPVAILAAGEVENEPLELRRQFIPLIQSALEGLRAGRWWLSFEERRFYDAELLRLLGVAGATRVAEDLRLQSLDTIAALARRSRPDRGDSLHIDPDPGVDIVLLWSRSLQQPGAWRGAAVPRTRIAAMVQTALQPLLSGQPQMASIRHARGPAIWGVWPAAGSVASVSTLHAVTGWELALRGPDELGRLDRRTLLWYGFTMVLVMTLGVGIGFTSYVIRREAEIGRLQSEFIAAVTHEFKSPITSIRLLVERLTSGRLRTASATEEYFDAITRETDRLDRLVSRVLESQRIQAGERLYHLVPGSAVEMAQESVWRLRPHADAKTIGIDLEITGHVPVVRMDKAALADALDNLVDNAIKYSPPGSRILIRVEARESNVCVEVCDQGIGIEEQDLPHVFNRFYRGRRGDQQNVRGTGLGLALVKAAAEGHGGTVEVSSAVGKGSRFCLRLPMEG